MPHNTESKRRIAKAKKGRSLTPEQKRNVSIKARKYHFDLDQAIEMYVAGYTQKQIAEELGVSYCCIQYNIRAHATPEQRNSSEVRIKAINSRITARKIPLPINDIMRMRDEGYTLLEIADKYKVSKNTIYDRIDEALGRKTVRQVRNDILMY